MTRFFHLHWALTICDTHFCIWKFSKFIFIGSPFWSNLVWKIAKFWRWKLWDQNFVTLDSTNIHNNKSNKPGFTFFFELRTKFVWLHGLLNKIILPCLDASILTWFYRTSFKNKHVKLFEQLLLLFTRL